MSDRTMHHPLASVANLERGLEASLALSLAFRASEGKEVRMAFGEVIRYFEKVRIAKETS